MVRFLFGGVAQATLRRSPCSVEIVRRPTQDSMTATTAMKILAATNGSDCSMAVVRSIAQRPWPARSQIRARDQRYSANSFPDAVRFPMILFSQRLLLLTGISQE